ncbi:hypothetical protein [Alloactinosynnema sp. L-07]|uniref:hypothetical protein n=1 Tax=Alloactinosynnema sp. L-07 TaxID=1653480 RepID=UPI00065EF260|nr:hypothetical protein [Alloactinosynnema sp. L-07]CRK60954.1 hypothetical protein [Alloactinosynnema sp. L-07]
MATALWVVTAALFAAFIIWRLRRANQTLTAILREDHADDLEPAEVEQPAHRIGRHRKQ